MFWATRNRNSNSKLARSIRKCIVSHNRKPSSRADLTADYSVNQTVLTDSIVSSRTQVLHISVFHFHSSPDPQVPSKMALAALIKS